MSLNGRLYSDKEIRGRISGVNVIHTDAYEIALRNGFEGTVEEWLESMRGEPGTPGDPFTYEDFTPEQLAALKGEQGIPGASGVHIGSDTPPDTANVWVNPDGDPTSTEDWEFDLEDGSTDTKTVVVLNSDEATASGRIGTLRVKNADGEWKEIPAIVGRKGDKGDPFVYDDFTAGQLADLKGEPGKDGTSATVSVSDIEGGHRITITDANGTKTVDVMDGEDGHVGAPGASGKDGNGIKSAVLNADYTLTLTFDDGTSYTTPSIRGATGATGIPGNDGSNGVSATHSWNGTVLTVTSASGTSSADLKGPKGDSVKGDPGADGVSPTVAISKSGKVTTVSITDKNGTKTATINDGADGVAGSAGKDGTSVTVKSVSESTADGGSNVVTFSDGKTVTIKNGNKGTTGDRGSNGVSPTLNVSKVGKVTTITITDASGTKTATINDGSDGATGATGATGSPGKDGKDYVLTASDKTEIAEMVENATIVQAPTYVDSLDKMTDTSKVYVLAETGHIWSYMDTTVEKEVTKRDDITSGYERGRLSSGGANSGDVQTHTLTPLIDLTKAEYQGKTIQIHLESNRYFSEATETYIMCATFDTNKNTIMGRAYSCLDRASGLLGGYDNAGMQAVIHSTNSATLTFPVPLVGDDNKTVGYMRFCGSGTVNGTVYITYQKTETVTGGQWVDTGTTYAPTLTDANKQAMVEEVVELVDTQLLTMIGDGVVTV